MVHFEVEFTYRKREKMEKYEHIISKINDRVIDEYSRIVRPINENSVGYLLSVNNIDENSKDAPDLLCKAMEEEIEVSIEIEQALTVAEREGVFDN